MSHGLNSGEMQKKNRTLVFQTLLEKGSMSRTALAAQVGLQKATITNIINSFQEIGIICVDGDSASGRRSEAIRLALDGLGILSLGVTRKDYQISLYSLEGKLLSHSRYRFGPGEKERFGEVFRRMKDEVCDFADRYGRNKILGVSLAVPGPYIIDREDGGRAIFSVSGFPELGCVDMQARLEDALGIPVFMKHDAKLSAFAEWKNLPEVKRDPNAGLVVIRSRGYGIGAGIVINGRIVEGRTGIAGEVGHMGVSLLREGSPGSWEHFAGCESACMYVQERLFEFPDGPLTEASTYTQILEARKNGDELADWAVKKMGWMLGYGIANLVYIINPDCIIIGEDYPQDEVFLGIVRDAVRRRLQLGEAGEVPIRGTALSDDSFLLGGYYYVLGRMIREDTIVEKVRAALTKDQNGDQ